VFDASLRPWIDPPLERLAVGMARLGLSANVVTVVGFAVGVAAWVAIALNLWTVALGLIALNRLADGLDGALARRLGPTDLGGYLDIVLDFIFYAGVPFSVAVARPEDALPAAFLIFSFIGTGGSFLAFAAVAARRGLTTQARGRKSIYYLGGLAEGAETIAVFVLICLIPEEFATIAWVFGGLCWITAVTRIAMAVSTFRQRPQEATGS